MGDSFDPAYRDLAWYGYDPRALAVLVVGMAILSWGVWLGRWYFEDLSGLADRAGALVIFLLAWAVWPLLAALFFYRTVTYTYRLTDRALLVDFGFWHPYQPPLPLDEIRQVAIRRGPFGRYLGIGTVEIQAVNRRLILPGIRQPETFVRRLEQLRHRDRSAKIGEGTSGT
jgi:membrane protein YdbS with pleckstrin-like domain